VEREWSNSPRTIYKSSWFKKEFNLTCTVVRKIGLPPENVLLSLDIGSRLDKENSKKGRKRISCVWSRPQPLGTPARQKAEHYQEEGTGLTTV